MSLIEQLGGYDAAKRYAESRNGADNTSIYDSLQVKLLEYRRQYNIYEMDDYVIHDGELMVFAMWSEAVKDCAYVGYAYAEDGFLLHKDEFRHATDAEIQAGKRLEVKA